MQSCLILPHVYYKALLPKGWPCTPFTSSKSRWSVVLFHVCHGTIYSFSETVMCTKYFSFTSSQQETFSHIILGCLMEISSFAVFPIDAEVVDLYWKSLWDSCWAISVFCTPKFCSWCWQFHSSSRIELSSKEVEITQHEMVPHLKDTEGEFWTWRTNNLTELNAPDGRNEADWTCRWWWSSSGLHWRFNEICFWTLIAHVGTENWTPQIISLWISIVKF